MRRKPDQLTLCVAATGLLLVSIVTVRAATRIEVGDAGAYLADVRRSAAALPIRIGPWFGSDVPVPTQAVDMLRPNVLVSRRYENLVTGESFTLLLIQTKDARDLLGHYPPVCYPNRGYVQESAEPRTWHVPADDAADGAGALELDGMVYGFSLTSADGTHAMAVANFMLTPGGAVAADMLALESQLTDRGRSHFGAAEVQVVMPGAMPEARRDEVVTAAVAGCRETIDRILAGYRP